MTHPLSNCCKAKAVVSVADEGTACYMCTGCNKPCDPHQEGEEKPTTQSWEEEFDKKFGKDGPEKNCDSIGRGAGCDDCSHNIEERAEHKQFVAETLATAEAEWKERLVKDVELLSGYSVHNYMKNPPTHIEALIKKSEVITLINSTK